MFIFFSLLFFRHAVRRHLQSTRHHFFGEAPSVSPRHAGFMTSLLTLKQTLHSWLMGSFTPAQLYIRSQRATPPTSSSVTPSSWPPASALNVYSGFLPANDYRLLTGAWTSAAVSAKLQPWKVTEEFFDG